MSPALPSGILKQRLRCCLPRVGGAITAERESNAAVRLTRLLRGNGTAIVYNYSDDNRVTKISHLDDGGAVMLSLEYSYTPDGLVESITETDKSTAPGHTITATVEYEYDNRNRLTRETRDDSGATGVAPIEFDIEYTYDQGGNRLTKENFETDELTEYYYDITNATDGGQHNNRLWASVRSIDEAPVEYLFYEYGPGGNVVQAIRQPDLILSDAEIGRFIYDTKGRLWVAQWGTCDHVYLTGEPGNEDFTVATEYRYDSGRQRYLVRNVDPDTLTPLSNSPGWRDYAGESIYADYDIESMTGNTTETAMYLSGVGRAIDDSGTTGFEPEYVGADLIGRKRLATDDNTAQVERLVFTAFGERVSNTDSVDRYGYAGAWGYERPDATDALHALGWLHVGERYYDPSAGRFMQRDPIGIRGGANVYLYVGAMPTHRIDPTGLTHVIHWRPRGASVGHTVIMTDKGVYISFVPNCSPMVAVLGCGSFSGRTLGDDIDSYGIPDDIWYIDGLDENAVGAECEAWDGSRWSPGRNCIDATFGCLGAGGGHVPFKERAIWFPGDVQEEIGGYPGASQVP